MQERLEGAQISRLYLLDDEPGPTGSFGFAFEFTTGGKLIVWAARDRFSPFSARLLFRWLEPPLIVLPRMAKAFSGGRDRDPTAEPPTDLQRRIEGQVIDHILHFREPTVVGGEQIEFGFKDQTSLHLAAVPIESLTSGGKRLLAAIDWAIAGPERTTVFIP